MYSVLYLWPGLPQLFRTGTWSAWCVAMFYAWFAAVVTGVCFLWTDFIPVSAQRTLLVIFTLMWFLGMLGTWRIEALYISQKEILEKEEDLFPRAQEAYLRRNWLEAEHLLWQRLEKHTDDVPARLLLVSLLRRMKRCPEALKQLDILKEKPGVREWTLEIQREREWIADYMTHP